MQDLMYFEGLAMEMLGRLNRLKHFTGHRSSIGFHHEEILRSTLRQLLSPRFQLRSGFSFNTENKVSSQGDILIVDENDPSPYLFIEGNLVVARSRAIVCVIEVKSTLNKAAFLEAVRNLETFQAVGNANEIKQLPANYIFAFKGLRFKPETLHGWYKDITIEDTPINYPNLIISLNCGGIQFIPPYEGVNLSNFGHHFIMGENESDVKAKSLSIFLISILKDVELRTGLQSNPYLMSQLDGLTWSRQYLRFGKGIMEESS